MRKKGLSGIVASVLIVLMVLLSSFILWEVVFSVAEDGFRGIDDVEDVAIVTSGGYTTWNATSSFLSVQVQRKTGKKEPVAIDFIFLINGSSVTNRTYDVLDEGATKVYGFNLSNYSRPEKVSVAFVYGKGVGNVVSTNKIRSIGGGGGGGGPGPIDVVVVPEPVNRFLIGNGTVLFNSWELNPAGERLLFVKEDIVPSIMDRRNRTVVYFVEFVNGSDAGNEYAVSWFVGNESFDTFVGWGIYDLPERVLGASPDFLSIDGNITAIFGDVFEIYGRIMFCGDGVCTDLREGCVRCPEDCGVCEGGSCEVADDCRDDYCVHGVCDADGIICGDNFCDAGESCSTCVNDCGTCEIGDGECGASESCSFSSDCGDCDCGDGVCDAGAGETFDSCWADCGYGSCGDGVCENGENSVSCSEDCGDYYYEVVYERDEFVDYDGWFRGTTDHGREFLVSPSYDAGAGNEQNHHWISVDYDSSSGGGVRVLLGYYPGDNLVPVMNSTYKNQGDIGVDSGEEIYIVSSYKGDFVSWVILEIDDDVTINSVSHKAMVTHDSLFGHKAKEYKFANSYLPYRILYPRNYNSSKSYPLVVVGSGSNGVGNDNVQQMELVTFSRFYFTDYYFDEEFEAFVVNVQIPGSQIVSPFYPKGANRGGPSFVFHPTWAAVNKDGFYTEGVVSLVNEMIANPNMNISSDKIYYAGFSYGGKAAYEIGKEAPDLWAAMWAVEGWPIGDAYYNDINVGPKNESLRSRLAEEVAEYKDIPFLVSVGSSGMNHSSYHGCEEINRQEGDCVYEYFPGVRHTGVPEGTFMKRGNMEWLFSKKKMSGVSSSVSVGRSGGGVSGSSSDDDDGCFLWIFC